MNLKLTTLLCATLFLGTAASAQKLEYEKWGKGINFATGDGLSTIKMSARIQNLFIYNQVLTPSGSSPTVQGMTRRARLKFDGQAFSPRIKYKIELGLSNRDTKYSDDANLVGGNARIILDAVVKYEVAKGTQLWFGQTKLPGNRERVVSSQKLQFVDRSNVNSKFNIDRDFGFQLRHKLKLGEAVLLLKESVSLGEGRNVIVTDN
ncbi:MAG: hypothetical protein HOG66_09290, partial [Flavobacteriales bacterium]|nr:hypothetical protein [Flavobacteriales bacterium]